MYEKNHKVKSTELHYMGQQTVNLASKLNLKRNKTKKNKQHNTPKKTTIIIKIYYNKKFLVLLFVSPIYSVLFHSIIISLWHTTAVMMMSHKQHQRFCFAFFSFVAFGRIVSWSISCSNVWREWKQVLGTFSKLMLLCSVQVSESVQRGRCSHACTQTYRTFSSR